MLLGNCCVFRNRDELLDGTSPFGLCLAAAGPGAGFGYRLLKLAGLGGPDHRPNNIQLHQAIISVKHHLSAQHPHYRFSDRKFSPEALCSLLLLVSRVFRVTTIHQMDRSLNQRSSASLAFAN